MCIRDRYQRRVRGDGDDGRERKRASRRGGMSVEVVCVCSIDGTLSLVHCNSGKILSSLSLSTTTTTTISPSSPSPSSSPPSSSSSPPPSSSSSPPPSSSSSPPPPSSPLPPSSSPLPPSSSSARSLVEVFSSAIYFRGNIYVGARNNFFYCISTNNS
eukprot:TRINITY_DN4357_c0_g1_i1.p2 TRINITY_DN4357_c0_g1~~TRINITY_DN4357_c0_g1_i1.p2  ORF type:complete len:158 (+),score=100.13 TRINITY_DN4357_c0_g1_i1:3-476(+)